MDCRTRLLTSALVLRAAATYVERHGYYIPLHRMDGADPDFDWDHYDEADHFDRSMPFPPTASELGAIAVVVYGWCNATPTDDGSPEYEVYAEAVSHLAMLYAPDGEGYGLWVFPAELAEDMRKAANDCEWQAQHPVHFERSE